MTETANVQAARRSYEIWNRGDLDEILADIPEDFACEFNVQIPGLPRVIRGREGARDMFELWVSDAWSGQLTMQPAHIIDLGGDRVLGLITLIATGEGSGVPMRIPYAHLATLRDAQVVTIEGFPSWERGLKQAGLTEIPPGT